ncbi:endolytic transglycosylase MltG [Flavihumibacter sp. ZG627]|uniref:endolytic transglycosylase MltG n=1 Tax=Flavihumibacter sp. ZG627 TaxID=1463156 RepID=UPI00057E76FA|nr:endolytic transglycosylase MltG [Flavihumibacter sp. ZG627]KIC90128.1 hypothetical protein HY58_12250 [Flavihumibacter sp. ZG627]
MKRILLIILLLVVLAASIGAWKVLGPATGFTAKTYYLEIPTGSSNEQVLEIIRKDTVVKNPSLFGVIASQLDYPESVKAGRYSIPANSSMLSIIRKLRNGQQDAVNLVITKLRTKEDLASLAARKLEFDSTAMISFLNNNDSLKAYGLDSNTVMTGVMPDTYTYFWNTTPSKVIAKIMRSRESFWNEERKQQATGLKLSPEQVVILASIVEEETNKNDEKDTIASVYINRLNKGMRLGADPTVKFALRDFGLKRIYNKHLAVESPYNTYRVAGLPPGPICTPQKVTIDAVLRAPQTNYLFFVARPDFSGYHVFAENYNQHLQYAKAYQSALDTYMKKKNQPEDTGNNGK